jgi:hypothetical protein
MTKTVHLDMVQDTRQRCIEIASPSSLATYVPTSFTLHLFYQLTALSH